jgi:hypothetical protein
MKALIRSLYNKLRPYTKAFREFLLGFTIYELQRGVQKDKGYADNLFMLVMFGDLAGLPVLPPYYSMRLLPYIIPQIDRWKRSVSKERDLTDILVE